MKKLLFALMSLITAVMAVAGNTVADDGSVQTARDAFVRFPVSTLDILSRSMRLDMLDYYDADSIYNVTNAMGGVSHIESLTPTYMKVKLTDVSTLEIKLLPYKGKQLVMSVYTVGSPEQAPDSDVRFFNEQLEPLERGKFLKIPRIKDFFYTGREGDMPERELLELVPFPTVKFDVSESGDNMTAQLTVGYFLDKERKELLKKQEKEPLTMRWNGSKWILAK